MDFKRNRISWVPTEVGLELCVLAWGKTMEFSSDFVNIKWVSIKVASKKLDLLLQTQSDGFEILFRFSNSSRLQVG